MKTVCTPTTLNCIKVLLLAGLLAITQTAAATIRYVSDSNTGNGTSWSDASGDLKAMIAASQPGDEVWVSEGVYITPANQSFVMMPGVKIYGGFAGTETSPAERDLSLHPSYLQPLKNEVIIQNDNNGLTSSALLDGFTIRKAKNTALVNKYSSPAFANCTFINNWGGNGGVIYNSYSSSTFINCLFSNNIAGYGGAVFNDTGSPASFTGCTFNYNNSNVYGGAVYNHNDASTTTYNNCTFYGNIAGQAGGGMYNQNSSAVITNCTVSTNTGANAAGIYNTNSTVTITGTSFINNTASGSGGSIYTSQSSVTLTGCTLTGNSSTTGNGGGIYNASSFSTFTLTNCLISGNVAARQGGGVYNSSSLRTTFVNCTISGNSAATGGGGLYNYNSSITIRNAIIYNNNSGVTDNGSTTTINFSLVQGITDTTGNNISGATDPLFVNPVAPGWSTGGDYHLQICSPVVNKGSNTYFAAGQTPDLSAVITDLDGNARFYNNGIVDLGVYERTGDPVITAGAGILYVKAGGTGTGASWACATGDLQAAINAASSGNQVWVAGGTYTPTRRADATGTVSTGDRNNAFVLKPDVKIYGGFAGTETSLTDRNLSLTANASILSGDLSGDDNGFTNNGENAYHVIVSAGNVGAATLDGFTVQGGNCNGGVSVTVNSQGVGTNGGGGINCSTSSPTLNNLIVKGNAGRYGAGLALSSSSAALTNSVISGNAGYYGGGIIASTCGATITNVLISGNTAVEQGGGMYNEWAVAPTLTNVTITGNTANYASGAMFNNLAVPIQLRNCIIYGNNSGINNNSGTPSIQYSLVQGETSTANYNIDGTVDPLFVNPVAAGLSTGGDYSLQVCSPAINAGSSTLYNTGQTPDLTGVTTDLNNATRVQGTAVDMGVYEHNGNPGGAELLGIDGDRKLTWISGVTTFIANNTTCRLLSTLQPTSSSFPLRDNVQTQVWVDNTQAANVVKRHYEIIPYTNQTVATGRATLYFTQAEFDDFNAVNTVKLPTAPTDAIGIANLAILQYKGYSMDGSGRLSTYTQGLSTINPYNNAIVWNATYSRWEISFDFAGNNGFFVTAVANPLPLSLLSFSGHTFNGYNQLQWQTADEVNTQQFELERSTDGRTFTAIATIPAKGNGSSTYSYKDYTSFNGKIIYRLKMVDADGKFTYSTVVTLTSNGNQQVSIYPNPASDVVYINTGNELLHTTAGLYDLNGRLLQNILITTATQAIPVHQLINGVYMIKLENGIVLKFIKQ